MRFYSLSIFRVQQGGDLPAGKIIEAKVIRKNNQEVVENCILCE